MNGKKKTGNLGEAMALDFLKKSGYKIIRQNWRHGKAEIDIIASYKEFIVFVEVKMRTTENLTSLHELVTVKQQKMIIKAAHEYIVEEDLNTEARFDIVLITVDNKQQFEMEHIDDAFQAGL